MADSGFDSDLDDLDRLIKDLEIFARRAIPFAARNGLNEIAFVGRKLWVTRIQAEFINRNTFTTRQVRVVKAKGGSKSLDSMEAVLGHLQPYMLTQEVGGTVRGKGASKPIPTSVAAGQAMGTRPRTKVVRKPMRLPSIRLGRRVRGGSRRQRNATTISQAVASGRKFVLLDTERGKGIARVTGRKRITVRLIWDLSRPSVRVPPTPTLARTVSLLEPLMPAIHRKAVIDQLRFNKVLGF